ncbi:MAG: hypothetical protein ACLQIB_45310 [Isosphaeraceae bacterium]
MQSSRLLLTAVVLAFPAAAYAQHGAVRGGAVRGGATAGGQQQQQMARQQQQMIRQQQRMQQQMAKEQQQMQQAQQRAMQQQAKAQQRAAQQQQNAAKKQQSAARQPAAAAKSSGRQGRNANGQNATGAQYVESRGSDGRSKNRASTAHKSMTSESGGTSSKKSGQAAKTPSNAGKQLTARERTQLAMEKERAGRMRRWAAFENWLLTSGYLSGYEARFRAQNAYTALDDWLAQQEALKAQGFVVDPLYSHYRTFLAQYTP